jgi:PHD/YefM family antitoxin component YafN of YafNO toxin-antitoxin module
MMKLNPQVIEKNGKKEFVVLPYDEYCELTEALEDYYDLQELRLAKDEAVTDPGVPLSEVQKKYASGE